MIQEFVKRWDKNKSELEKFFSENHPEDYKEIVKKVFELISTKEYGDPNPNIIHEINDSDYQGTLLYLVPDNTYQPSDYYYVKVYYGSCGGCDTLEGLKDEGNYGESPTKAQVAGYMTLALHVLQEIKKI